MLKKATKILTASEYIKNKVKIAYGRDASVCQLGAETRVFKPMDNTNRKRLLYIGERDRLSGYYFVKEVTALIDKVMKIDLKIIDFKKGNPQVNDKDLAFEYSNSMATICAASNEPFGLVPLESMACETPVLAVDEGGYRETVVDGRTGYLLERKPEVFAEKILYLANHPEAAAKRGRAGRAHVKKNFTWEKHNRILERELKKIAVR